MRYAVRLIVSVPLRRLVSVFTVLHCRENSTLEPVLSAIPKKAKNKCIGADKRSERTQPGMRLHDTRNSASDSGSRLLKTCSSFVHWNENSPSWGGEQKRNTTLMILSRSPPPLVGWSSVISRPLELPMKSGDVVRLENEAELTCS